MSHLSPLRPGPSVRVVALALILGVRRPPTLDGPRSRGGGKPRAWRSPPLSPSPAPRRSGPPRPGPPPEDDETPARLTLGPGGRDLHLTGDLTEGIAARVAQVLAAHPRWSACISRAMVVWSRRRSSLAGIVTARRLSTVVRDTCISACTLVFVHGRRRYLLAGGRSASTPPTRSGGRRADAGGRSRPGAGGLHCGGRSAGLRGPGHGGGAGRHLDPPHRRVADGRGVTAVVGRGRFPETGRDVTASPRTGRPPGHPSGVPAGHTEGPGARRKVGGRGTHRAWDEGVGAVHNVRGALSPPCPREVAPLPIGLCGTPPARTDDDVPVHHPTPRMAIARADIRGADARQAAAASSHSGFERISHRTVPPLVTEQPPCFGSGVRGGPSKIYAGVLMLSGADRCVIKAL